MRTARAVANPITSGHTPKHPDFNEEGKWVGCASYKTIKSWLAAHNRAGEHPTLRFNFRADGTPMVLKPKAKSDPPSERDSGSNQPDSSSSSRGGPHYQPRDNQRRDIGSVHFSEREDSSSRGGTSHLSTAMTPMSTQLSYVLHYGGQQSILQCSNSI